MIIIVEMECQSFASEVASLCEMLSPVYLTSCLHLYKVISSLRATENDTLPRFSH